ncbi:hypothetical protein [Phenylobacterium sp.]|uniref:hypothetical protein n=1 Tax=Phenylobacterium sp. TaxID=1871053 RepID=UPI0008D55225|nr:hypothetical protein [Phenylobacterium sp.]MBC7168146.1 hypothetical protein [Phenylobacterium sp.]OHB34652.1 MAG: hypothetical protein A2882_10205 [Phenylobacterium sp. RIFCSPHIGHO2_01_FULL_70_10]
MNRMSMPPRLGGALAAAALFAAPLALAPPARAQHVEGDANSALLRYGRMMAEPGTFWLDGNGDREVIRYTTPRDIRLCLPRAAGVASPRQAYAVQVTWDQTNQAVLTPGNCLYFDARRVSLKPAEPLPAGVTLEGRIDAARALQR